MADDVEMIPVEMTPVAEEPPKANPLARPTVGAAPVPHAPAAPKAPATPATAALKPGLKLPPKPGGTVGALRPGLKLPPKPGATVAGLKPGLKLPPKPGATVGGLKPGLKLPTKPGIPQIRKPGASVAAKPLPRPVTPTVATTPAAPAAAPAAAPDAEAKPDSLSTLKTVTQKLKGVTQPIPQQAILHKTGIIAEDAMTEAQKEAAKHKTARISLSDALGVAPVKNENAPMKTIRIKRPSDIAGGTSRLPAQQPPVAHVAPAAPAAPAAAKADAPAAAPAAAPSAATTQPVSVTQRKTLKISRPGGPVRPSGKFTIKRPGDAAKPAAAAAPAAGAAGDGDVADIPDIPSMPQVPVPVQAVDDVAGWVQTLSAIVQLAACAAIGVLAWFLYQNTQTNYF